jgi:hypothetical protein
MLGNQGTFLCCVDRGVSSEGEGRESPAGSQGQSVPALAAHFSSNTLILVKTFTEELRSAPSSRR